MKERLVTISAKVSQEVKDTIAAEAQRLERRPATYLSLQIDKLAVQIKNRKSKEK